MILEAFMIVASGVAMGLALLHALLLGEHAVGRTGKILLCFGLFMGLFICVEHFVRDIMGSPAMAMVEGYAEMLFLPLMLFFLYSEHEYQQQQRQQRVSRRLAKQSAILRETQDIARIGGWELDLLNDRFTWTGQVYSVLNVPADFPVELERANALFTPESREQIEAALHRARTEGESWDLQIQLLGEDDPPRWVRIIGRAERAVDGQIVRLSGTIQDITDLKRIQSQVQTAKREWENTFDCVTDMIALIDMDFRIVRVNQAMAEVLDSSVQQLIGTPCYRQMHHCDHPPDFCPLMKLRQDGKMHECEFHDDTTGRDYWVTVSPLGTPDVHSTLVVHVVRDITHRKQAEQKLQRTVDELERFNRLAVGRELRMIELKREVNDLAGRLNNHRPYDLSFAENASTPNTQDSNHHDAA